MPIMHPIDRTVKCTHPLDMRHVVMDGYRILENGECTDTLVEKEFCDLCGEEIEQPKEEITY